ncbi:MAG TPA: ABC transporter ATP-binding protein [Cyclobacteriaceae bacterium]|nr:ABC transporter ATP-binding protein [Cyclobacteriaceae bacterium]
MSHTIFSKTPVIEVKDVYKSFKAVKAVRGISLKIFPGQFVALLGPNGAGKTTLVEMIEGIQKPDRGEILIFGKGWNGNEDELRRVIGLSLQETYFIDKLTVWETLNLFGSFYDLGPERSERILHLTGLEEKRKSFVVHLSGGQRQRLALGIALLNEPRILLLDEPTTGLDPNARREIWAILGKLREQSGTSLILTTHYMEEAEQLCDYVIIIDHGVILREGARKQLLEETNQEKIAEFSLDGNFRHHDPGFGDSPFPISWDVNSEKGNMALSNVESELPQFLEYLKKKNLPLKNLEFRRKTLDDIFTSLTGRRLDE